MLYKGAVRTSYLRTLHLKGKKVLCTEVQKKRDAAMYGPYELDQEGNHKGTKKKILL